MNKVYERVNGRIEAITQNRKAEVEKLKNDINEHKAKAEAARAKAEAAVKSCNIEEFKKYKAEEDDHKLNAEMFIKYLETYQNTDAVEPAECEEVAKSILNEQLKVRAEAENKLKKILTEAVSIITDAVEEIENGNEIIRAWHKNVKPYERINGHKVHSNADITCYDKFLELIWYRDTLRNEYYYTLTGEPKTVSTRRF